MRKLLFATTLLSLFNLCEARDGKYTVDNNGWVNVGSDFSNRKISIDRKKLIEIQEDETILERKPSKSEMGLDDHDK